ncbi:protein translocase subunit SecF [Candidatus Roizmanbacteria bacterium]|nr:protein translocase subunit SecF [Candidatus Roizmanbacteria bacterium]
MKYRWLYFLISLTVIVAGLFSIYRWGFRPSIDFTGGTDIEYELDRGVDKQQIASVIKSSKLEVNSWRVKDNQLTIKAKPIDEKQELLLRGQLENKLKLKVKTQRFDTVGPVIGQEAINKTIVAASLGILAIIIYISLAFKGFYYALSAVLATVHDFLVVMGSYSLISHFFGAELDTMFVTALLTSMSFSTHDTIIIFDKIREYFRSEGKAEIDYFANKALTETMVRSVNNSMTIIFMLLALVLLGGSTIRFFAVTLLIGTITGTYSSPFVATPILVWIEKMRKKKN